jgi:Flp pilus assembly protein TadG
MRSRALHRVQRQSGMAMVEFAITLPLLLLLLFAIGEFGRMLYQYNSLLQASRDAGRYVAGKAWNRTLGKVDLTGDPQLVPRTKNVAVYGAPANPNGYPPVVPGLSTGDVSVSAVKDAGVDTEYVEVSITFTFRPVIGNSIPAFIGNEIALSIPLVATTVMRAL